MLNTYTFTTLSLSFQACSTHLSYKVLSVLNTRIIDRHKKWNALLFKEAMKIKEIKPALNTGLKASKELQLF